MKTIIGGMHPDPLLQVRCPPASAEWQRRESRTSIYSQHEAPIESRNGRHIDPVECYTADIPTVGTNACELCTLILDCGRASDRTRHRRNSQHDAKGRPELPLHDQGTSDGRRCSEMRFQPENEWTSLPTDC